jgi:3-oxoacyl-[acyl-carrier protein] reductase
MLSERHVSGDARGLRGSLAIVTGASRRGGIGAAICRELAGHGAAILFTHWRAFDHAMSYADEDGPDALEQELRQLGVPARGIEIDLARAEAYATVLDAAAAMPGVPAILVNNAAHSTRDGHQRLDAATLDAHYAVNLRSTALLSVEFVRRHGGRGARRIINLTSGQSQGPMIGELAYAATKGAIEAFTRSLAAEVAPLGITVNAVNPGPTDTGWMTEAIRADLLPRMGLGRLGLPADAARLIGFLAGDAGGWITGQTIHSEGGFLRG